MSLLSTFSILFETDAKKAADDVEELSDALQDTEETAEEAAKRIKDLADKEKAAADASKLLTKSIVGLIGTFVTLDAIASKVFDQAANIDTIGKLSQTIGLNIQEMDAWGIAAERNGGSAEAFRGTVESLQGSLQDISITGGGEIINTLAMIGVQATKADGKIKSAFEILPEIAEAFSKLTTEQSFAFGKRLGLDQGTILTLQQSRYEVDKLVERQKALGGVTKEGYEAAAIFNDQWDDTKRSFNSLWLSANNTILPMFSSILKGFESIATWIKENKQLFLDIVTGVALVFLPILAPITAISVGLLALTEDVWAWVNGSKSAIGELVGSFENMKENVLGFFDEIIQGWENLKNMIENGIDATVDLFAEDPTKKPKTNGIYVNEDGVPISAYQAGEVYMNEDGVPVSNNDIAAATIANYSSTNLNQGGSSVNQRTQHNQVSIGGANIDARGMSGNEAKSAINASMKESVEMAIGQLNDGVQR